MAEINPSAQSSADILQDNVSGYINWALDVAGRDRRWIVRQLRRRYPNAEPMAIETAYAHVIGTRAAGRRLTTQRTDAELPEGHHPSRRGTPTGYRYVVLLQWAMPAGTPDATFHAIVDSREVLTRDQIYQQAYDLAEAQIAAAMRRNRRYPSDIPQASNIQFSILTAERMTQ